VKQIDIKIGIAQNLMQLRSLLDLNKNKKHKKLGELFLIRYIQNMFIELYQSTLIGIF